MQEGAAQAVLGIGLTGLILAGQDNVAVFLFIVDQGAHRCFHCALGSLHFNGVCSDCDSNVGRHGNGLITNSRHDCTAYQISQRSSPPTFWAWADIPSMTPREVVRMQIPRPFWTRGISVAPT